MTTYIPRGTTTLRARVLNVLSSGRERQLHQICAEVRASLGAVGSAMDFLMRKGVVVRVAHGTYKRFEGTV